jgi:drug/metabolite transporter (DMT)-like permease
MPPQLKPHILLFIVNLIYAGNYTVAKIAMPAYISPEAFIVIRASVGALTFLLIHSIWVNEKIESKDWFRLILCGLFGIAINQLMFFKGLSLTSPINASLIMITVPIIVIVLSAIALRERITYFKFFGVLFGLMGAAIIILSGKKLAELTISKGDLFIFMNATSYAIYLILVKSIMKKYEAITVMRWVFFFGLLMVIPFGVFQLQEIEWHIFPQQVWISVIYVLVGTTILTYLLNGVALKISSPALVSTYIYLQPLLATVIAILSQHDTLNFKKLIAAAFIFFGVYLVSFKRNSQQLAVK